MGNNGSQVSSTAVGIAVGFGILGLLFIVAILQFFCKYKCKKCKKNCSKKKKPSMQDKMMTKMGMKKSPPPFNISSVIK